MIGFFLQSIPADFIASDTLVPAQRRGLQMGRGQNAGVGRKPRRRFRFVLWSASLAVLALPAWAQDEEPPPDDEAEVARTIVVTGSRLPRAGQQGASPTQAVTREDFLLTGVGNVEQTINLMPQIVPGFTNTSNNPGSGAATLDLRGLGSVRTLILVNGRRWIASDAGEVPEVDVSTIPAALIKRVDIVTGGASAVYGSDAVTGVVNFILDDGLKGLHLEARQSVTEQGDGRTTSADLSYGASLFGGRARLAATAGWLNQRPVRQGDRTLSRVTLQDGCGVPGTRQETGASRAVNDPACAPPNERAFTAGGSNFIPGSRIFGAAFFPVPGSNALIRNQPGVRFDSDGRPLPFSPALNAYNFAPDNYLQVGFERWSGNLLASFEASPALTPYVELSYIQTRSPQQLAPVPALLGRGSATVPVARVNLANPFLTAEAKRVLDLSYGVDALGRRGFIGTPASGFSVNPAFTGDADGIIVFPVNIQSRLDLGPRQIRNRRDAMRGLVGARGDIGSGWSYDLYHSRSRVEHVTAYRNSGSALRLQQALLAVIDPATGQPVCMDPSNGCAPANIFGEGNLSPAAADFIRTHPTDVTIVEEQVAEASVRGDLPLLRAGNAGVAAGVNWRRSSYSFEPDPSLFTGDDLGFQPGTPASGRTSVWELFSEARVPLLADLPLARELTAEVGLRWSNYSSVGQAWTWKAMAEWVPVGGLKLRGGLQRAVRAPNVRELFEEPSTSTLGALDPCSPFLELLGDPEIAAACLRNGVPAGAFLPPLAFALSFNRGDPNLDAETARTLTIGAAFTPGWARGLIVTADYYDIRIRRPIGQFGGGSNLIVFGCITGGGDPADPLCQAIERGPDGSILSIDQPTANLHRLRARGIDWQIAYAHEFGDHSADRPNRVQIHFSGTRYLESGFQADRNVPNIDCAGFFGDPCGNTIGGAAVPEWKLYNRATWTLGPVAATVRHRWFSSTLDGRIRFAKALGIPPIPIPEEGRKLESRHYFDLATSFRLRKNFDLTIGVNNLTGRKPAITGSNQVQANTDPSLYDVLGRRYFAALRLSTQ